MLLGGFKLRLLFIINTPAQAYTWKNVIQGLMEKGHCTKLIAREYGSTPELLTSFGYDSSVFKARGARSSRLFTALDHFQKCYELSYEFKPSIVLGFGLDAAVTAFRFRKPCIVFIDDELTYVQNMLTYLYASAVLSPQTFKKRLGRKHILINSYKEFAYLHPDYFRPDPGIYHELGITEKEKYVILRFNAFDAVHDIGKRGFSSEEQKTLVKELSKYARVFISPEGKIPSELTTFCLPIKKNRIHHALCYAHLLITDTQTMATEAAILGTPVVRCNSFVGQNDMGNFLELEKRYDLIYSFRDVQQAVKKAKDLITLPDLKERWMKKREKLVSEKTNLTKLLIDVVDGYPESIRRLIHRKTGAL